MTRTLRPAAPPRPALAIGGQGDTLEPLLGVDDLARVLAVGRRTIERERAAGRLPRPDLHIGRMPRWRPDTIRDWINRQ
jgi:predicted DNA-binding transcriptional regulator AlpA